MDEQIYKAMFELEEWLSDPSELGKRPSRIACTNIFEDDDGIKCIIFKFKKNIFSKWCLGIVSESGTYSEMKEYHKETEINDAKEILEMLKNYWKEMAENSEN